MPASPSSTLTHSLAIAAAIVLHSGCSEPTQVDPPPARGVIAGRVIGGLGGPVAGAVVTTAPASRSAVTDADGRFVLGGLAIASYRVVVAKDTATASVECAAAADTAEVALRLPMWRLVFADEFDGAGLDAAKWDVAESDNLSDSPNRFRRHAVTVADGRLRITSRPDTIEPGRLTGGFLATRATFEYGRFEARARLPRGRGLWPAHWLWPDGKYDAPEIDIVEMLGHDPSLTYATYHYGDSTGARRSSARSWRGFDRSAAYYTYALEWYPGECRWFIDGVEVFRTPTVQPDEPMNYIIDTIVGGSWSGLPDASTVWPQFHDVDWVRIYRAVE